MGFTEISDDGRVLKIVFMPKEVPMVREIVRSMQKKVIKLIEKQGFEIISNKKNN